MPIRSPQVLLDQANEQIEAGDVVSAGCYAREAIRRHLRNLCDDHGCRPTGRDQTPRDLARALERAGVLNEAERQALNRLVNVCHRAAHLYVSIRATQMRLTIDTARSIVAEPIGV